MDLVDGVVEAIAPGGRGIVRDDGGIIFARGGLPGERVRIRVHRRQKGVRHGVVVAVLEASADRVSPDCALHPRCGGCDLLDLAGPPSLRARVHIVMDALTRVGKIPRDVVEAALRPIASADAARRGDALRRRARLTIERGLPTFSAPESHERVPVEACPALHPALNAAMALVPALRLKDRTQLRLATDDRGHVSAAIDSGDLGDLQRLVDAGVAHGAIVLAHDDDELERGRAGDPVLIGEVAPGHGACASDAGIFTQATRFGGMAIIAEVMRAADVGATTHVLELFAGAGHITVPLLERGATVDAVEGAGRAVHYLRENTRTYGARCSVRTAYIDGTLPITGAADVVVLDPPRTGIPGFDVLLERLKAKRMVLVSCDPATGARDIGLALKAGWGLVSLVPIDAFPRTSHVEWVAHLER